MAARHQAPEQLLGRAFERLSSGDAAGAKTLCQQVLARSPRHADALHFLGLALSELGDTPAALQALKSATKTAPHHVDAWNNLGNVAAAAGDWEQALAAFEQALALAPAHVPIAFNLAVARVALGRFKDAIPLLVRVREAAPGDPTVLDKLAEAQAKSGDFEAARVTLRAAREIAPAEPALKRKLGLVYAQLIDAIDRGVGDATRAVPYLDEWLAIDPGNEVARHTRAAYAGTDPPARASDGYVRATFDQFAESYERVFEHIRAQGAELCFELLDLPGAPLDALLDAGCGTGLFGRLARPHVARLVGVDLSSKMLERARARDIYDELFEGELLSFLAAHEARYDAVAASDVLGYFGDLAPLFAGFRRVLSPEGKLVVSIERHDDEPDFKLGSHGRYSHRRSYFEGALEAAGFALERVREADAMRLEYGHKVPAWIVLARATGSTVQR